MSLGRAAGPILATVCGVCTAYAAFAPELQKQAVERFEAQHPADATTTTTTTPATSHEQTIDTAKQQQQQQQQPHQTIISNDDSLGKQVKAVVSETKAEIAAAEPRVGWFGLGAWKGAFGGAASPREGEGEEKKKS